MEQGKVILNLLNERIENFTNLKDLLLRQQKALVEADTSRITHFAEMQLTCLEKIQRTEKEWVALLNRVKAERHLETLTTDHLVALDLDDHQSSLVFAYLDQVKKLVKEIEIIRHNNTLLIHNSLALVKSTMEQLQYGPDARAVYHPHRKSLSRHLLLNKKM
ncbi:MAG: hypothetical protein Kow0042_30580 [Calditrichia bacterium]